MRTFLSFLLALTCASVSSAEVLFNGTVNTNQNFTHGLADGTYRVRVTIFGVVTTDTSQYGVNGTGGSGWVATTTATDSYTTGTTVITAGTLATWQAYENRTGNWPMMVEAFPIQTITQNYVGSGGVYITASAAASGATFGSWSNFSSDTGALVTLLSSAVTGRYIQVEAQGTENEVLSWRYRTLSTLPILPPYNPGGGGGGGNEFYRLNAPHCPVPEGGRPFSDYIGDPNGADVGLGDSWTRAPSLASALFHNPHFLMYGISYKDLVWGYKTAFWYYKPADECVDDGGGGGGEHCCDCNCSECLTLAQLKEWGGDTLINTLKDSNTDLADKLYAKLQQSNDDLATKIKDKLRDDASDLEKQSPNDQFDLSGLGLQLPGAETEYADPGSLSAPVENRWQAVAQKWGWLKEWRPSQNGQLAFSVDLNHLPEGWPQLGVLEYSDRGNHPLRGFFDQLRPIIRGLASAGIWFCVFVHLGRYLTAGGES